MQRQNADPSDDSRAHDRASSEPEAGSPAPRAVKPTNPVGIETLEASQDEHTAVPLPSGRSVHVTARRDGSESILIRNRAGRLEIGIELTANGPRLIIEEGAIALASRTVTVECEDFSVEAERRISLRAPDVAVEATEGDLDLKANDSVEMHGEQIRMNCDPEEPVAPWMSQELAARPGGGPAARPTSPRKDVEGDAALARQAWPAAAARSSTSSSRDDASED